MKSDKKRVDPRIKLFMLLSTGVISFFAANPNFLACLFLPGLLFYICEKWYGQALRLSVSFALLIAFQVVLLGVKTANAGTMIFGIILFYVLRVYPIFMLFYWMVETTTISEWMKGMEQMHMPKGFTITTATLLRYAPTVSHEFYYIKNTMKMRGIEMSFQNFARHPVRMTEYSLTPLLLRSVKIAEDLSAAAMARGIENTVSRNSYFDVRIGKKMFLSPWDMVSGLPRHG